MGGFIERRRQSVEHLAPRQQPRGHAIDERAAVDDADMSVVFAVIGEHRDDPDRLLVLGDDGQYYDYGLLTGRTEPVVLDRSWATDRAASDLAWAFGD